MTAGFTRIALGREYAAGVNMPAGSADALKLARANAAGTNLEYITAATAVAGDDTLATALAPHLVGRHLVVDASGNIAFRPDPQYVEMVDDFLGVHTTGALVLGDTPWATTNTGGITITQTNQGGGALTNLAGRVSIATGAATNDVINLFKANTAATAFIDLDQVDEFTTRVSADATSSLCVFGFGTTIASDTLGTDSIRFVRDTSVDTLWRAIRRVGGVDTNTVVLAAASGTGNYGLRRSGTNFLVYQDTNFLGSLPEIANVGVNMGFRLKTLTTAAKTLLLDRVSMRSTAFTGRVVFV